MKMKTLHKNLALFASAVLMVSLNGCGSSGGGSGDSGSASASVESISPITPYTVEVSSQRNGKTLTMKQGADGDFKVTKVSYEGVDYPILDFSDEVSTPYTVSSLVVEEAFSSTDSTGSYAGTVTSDYAAGTEHIVVTSSPHGTVDCVNEYTPILPISINDVNDLPDGFDEETLSSTTCPEWVNDEASSDEEPSSMQAVKNQTINGSSHISTYYSY
jgi:hypothetical protein